MIERLRAALGRKFVRDTLALQIAKILVAGIGALSALVVFRLLGPTALGIFGLAQSLLSLIGSLDLTGLGPSTLTRLGIAIGARDHTDILDLMAFYVKLNLLINAAILIVLLAAGGPIALLVQGDAHIGVLAAGLAFGAIADGLYNLIVMALQARRSMHALAALQVVNQAVLSLLLIAAAISGETAEALVLARIVYSYTTLAIASGWYLRLRERHEVAYPPVRAIFRRAVTVPVRPYLRFGVANAVDRSIANLFIQIPIQLVGVFGGPTAVGYLDLAMSGIEQARILLLGITENIAAIIPQAVGRKDFRTLWRDFRRMAPALLVGSAVYYAAVAAAAPLLVVLFVGEEWIAAIPVIFALAVFGAVTTTGSIFGPLYRALDQMRAAIAVKLVALAIAIPLGAALLIALTDAGGDDAQRAAIGGGAVISLIYCISVSLTAVVTLRRLRALSQTSGSAPPDGSPV
ncbi:MAG: oligosaccharide flippase family protein [Candidatus Flexifilum sp.]|jgi:O-antigen/teichoic acid export membrane protein